MSPYLPNRWDWEPHGLGAGAGLLVGPEKPRCTQSCDNVRPLVSADRLRSSEVVDRFDDLGDVETAKAFIWLSWWITGRRPPSLEESEPGPLMANVVLLAGPDGLTRGQLVHIFAFLDQAALQHGLLTMLDGNDVTESLEDRPNTLRQPQQQSVYRSTSDRLAS